MQSEAGKLLYSKTALFIITIIINYLQLSDVRSEPKPIRSVLENL